MFLNVWFNRGLFSIPGNPSLLMCVCVCLYTYVYVYIETDIQIKTSICLEMWIAVFSQSFCEIVWNSNGKIDS